MVQLSKYYLIIFLFLFTHLKLFAQNNEKINELEKIISINTQKFFKRNLEVDSIRIEFRNQNSSFLELFNSKKMNFKSFDLKFEEDKYILKNNFKELFNLITLIDSIILNNKLNLKFENDFIFSLTISDGHFEKHIKSLNYSFCNKEILRSSLQKFYEKNYKSESTYLFQAVVEKNGTISNVSLLRGKNHSFSKLIKKELNKTNSLKIWYPMTNSTGSPVRSITDIFISFQNKNVDVSISSKGRVLKIKDSRKNGIIYF